MKFKLIIIALLVFSCKAVNIVNVGKVEWILNPDSEANLKSISIISHIFENILYVPENKKNFEDFKQLTLKNVDIFYEKDTYFSHKKFDSIIVNVDSGRFSSLKDIESKWPDKVPFNDVKIIVRYKSVLLNSHKELVFDGCMKNVLILVDDKISTSNVENIDCNY